MAAPAVTIYPTATAVVRTGGQAATAIFGPVLGGLIQNPFQAQDQDLEVSETLYIDISGADATPFESATTSALEPGAIFSVPALTTKVSVNALGSGHRFSGFILQPSPPAPIPQGGGFPPLGPTTLTKIVPSLPYQQYNDDETIDAFFDSYNTLAQSYVDWAVDTPLPVYTNASISGPLLDWVALGLYGMQRPTLSSGRNRVIGPFNTVAFNTLPFNVRKAIGPTNIAVTTDDVFKRILTWNLYRGDGLVFNIRWLKRRIVRFLMGPSGTAPNVDDTSPVSVTIGPGIVAIRISSGSRKILGGALYNRHEFNRMPYNRLITEFVPGPTPLPLEPVLKQAIEGGALVLPFQYRFVVTIGGAA